MTEKLVIAVLTYRRPDDLAELLPQLVAQARQAVGLGMRARVQVVDNDPQASARQAVAAIAAAHPAEVASDPTGGGAGAQSDQGPGFAGVHYAHEAVPGIAAARSRALAEGDQDDWLCFIDDDERPGDHWLVDLVTTARAEQAVGVAGPVRSVLADDADPWLVRSGFFDRAHRQGLATGADITEAATNNLLLDMRFVRRHGITFATHLGLTGGEDSLFTRALVRHGGRLVWCAQAQVSEPVAPRRATRRWVLQRALSYGNAHALVALTEQDSPAVRVRLVGSGLARLAVGLARTGRASLALPDGVDVRGQAQGLRLTMRGVGMLLGAGGWAWSEYARDGRHLVRATLPGQER